MDCTLCSIDASTKSSGIAVFKNGAYYSSTLLQFPDKQMNIRFSKMCLALIDQLNSIQPDVIYMEEAAVVRNAQTQRFLVRLQGVVYGWAVEHSADCEFIRPGEWRALSGMQTGKMKRSDLKNEAIRIVREKLNIDVNDDVAESILIGIAAINKFNKE